MYQNASSEEELLENLAESNIFDRNFLSDFEKKNYFSESGQDPAQKETKSLKKFLDKNLLDFAINFHDGTKVVNYPLDQGIQGAHDYAKGSHQK